MANAPSVWIVVLNWNGSSDTLTCLQSLQQLHYPERRIVVVDNGSTDGSVDALRGAQSKTGFELIEAERNLGYAGGNNLGIRHALDNGAEFILVLNNAIRSSIGCFWMSWSGRRDSIPKQVVSTGERWG